MATLSIGVKRSDGAPEIDFQIIVCLNVNSDRMDRMRRKNLVLLQYINNGEVVVKEFLIPA